MRWASGSREYPPFGCVAMSAQLAQKNLVDGEVPRYQRVLLLCTAEHCKYGLHDAEKIIFSQAIHSL